VKDQRKAFTLMEMVLVMAILVVISALAYPAIDSLYASSRLTAAQDMIRARWSETRSRALSERRSYRFAVKDSTVAFKIPPDSTEFWGDGDPSSGQTPDDQKPLVMEGNLPDKVLFGNDNGTTGSGGDWRTLVTFLSDGTAKEDVEINLSTRGAGAVTLKLRASTGNSSTASLAASRSDS